MGRKKLEFARSQLNIRIDIRLMNSVTTYCKKVKITRTEFVENAIHEKLLRED